MGREHLCQGERRSTLTFFQSLPQIGKSFCCPSLNLSFDPLVFLEAIISCCRSFADTPYNFSRSYASKQLCLSVFRAYTVGPNFTIIQHHSICCFSCRSLRFSQPLPSVYQETLYLSLFSVKLGPSCAHKLSLLFGLMSRQLTASSYHGSPQSHLYLAWSLLT